MVFGRVLSSTKGAYIWTQFSVGRLGFVAIVVLDDGRRQRESNFAARDGLGKRGNLFDLCDKGLAFDEISNLLLCLMKLFFLVL